MDWQAALTALLGTIVGASVTLATDRVRWRRDQRERRYDARRDSYAAYLAAQHTTSEALRSATLGDGSAEDRRSAAWAAFRSANLNAVREQLGLLAPAPIVQAAGDTFRGLRQLRDIVAEGHDLESPDYRRVLHRYQKDLMRLRNVMRADLGSPSLDEDETS